MWMWVSTNTMFHVCDTYPPKIAIVGKTLSPISQKDPIKLARLSVATTVHLLHHLKNW